MQLTGQGKTIKPAELNTFAPSSTILSTGAEKHNKDLAVLKDGFFFGSKPTGKKLRNTSQSKTVINEPSSEIGPIKAGPVQI